MKPYSHYEQRDIEELDKLGNYYSTHIMAMTAEHLDSKSDIAAELGYRDLKIRNLVSELITLRTAVEDIMANVGAGATIDEVSDMLCNIPVDHDKVVQELRVHSISHHVELLIPSIRSIQIPALPGAPIIGKRIIDSTIEVIRKSIEELNDKTS